MTRSGTHAHGEAYGQKDSLVPLAADADSDPPDDSGDKLEKTCNCIALFGSIAVVTFGALFALANDARGATRTALASESQAPVLVLEEIVIVARKGESP